MRMILMGLDDYREEEYVDNAINLFKAKISDSMINMGAAEVNDLKYIDDKR